MTADKLVVGDIVIIKNGSRVPADARVLVGWFHGFFKMKLEKMFLLDRALR